MENGLVDVTSLEEEQEEDNNSKNLGTKPVIPSLIREIQIDRISDQRGKGARLEYLIKWKPVKQAWISAADVAQFPELIKAFEKRAANKPVYIEDEQESGNEEDKNDAIDGNDEDVDDRRHSARSRQATKRFVDESNTSTPIGAGKRSRKSSLRSSRGMELKNTKGMEGEDEEDDSDKEYSVELVLKRREKKAGRVEYFVKWNGFGPKHNSWEPQNSVKHLNVVKEFEKEWQKNQKEEKEEEEEDEEQEFKVEYIVEKRAKKNNTMEYYIKWKGYDASWNSWEPRKGLEHLDIFKKYEAEQAEETAGGTPVPSSSTRSTRGTATPSSVPSKKRNKGKTEEGGDKPGTSAAAKEVNVEPKKKKKKKQRF